MSKVMGNNSRVGTGDASASSSSSEKTASNGLKKGPWTAEEDQKLIDYIKKHGHGRWRTLPKNAGLKRCGKSCRLRWTNYLRPDIKRGRFSSEEEETIIQLHSILGNKWSVIAARLPGRTDNEIKNYWNTHIKKRLLRMGIDPATHTPRLDLLELSSILSSSLHNYTQFPNLPNLNLLGLLGSSSLSQNKDLLDLAKQLVISQNIPRETPPNYPEHLLVDHHFQNRSCDQIVSTDQNFFWGGQSSCSLNPSSSWDSNYGCFNQNPSSLLGVDDHSSFPLGNNTEEYMAPSPLLIDPKCSFWFNDHVEEAKKLGVGSTLYSPISNNSSCTFNSSCTTTTTFGAGRTCNNEDEGILMEATARCMIL